MLYFSLKKWRFGLSIEEDSLASFCERGHETSHFIKAGEKLLECALFCGVGSV